MNGHKSVKPLISLALAGIMAIAIGIWVGTTFDQLISHSVLQEYALAYLEAHRAYFLRTNLVEYHKKFSVDTRMLQKIVAQAKTKGAATIWRSRRIGARISF